MPVSFNRAMFNLARSHLTEGTGTRAERRAAALRALTGEGRLTLWPPHTRVAALEALLESDPSLREGENGAVWIEQLAVDPVLAAFLHAGRYPENDPHAAERRALHQRQADRPPQRRSAAPPPAAMQHSVGDKTRVESEDVVGRSADAVPTGTAIKGRRCIASGKRAASPANPNHLPPAGTSA